MTESELKAIAWFSPGHYPSRCTPEMNTRIAEHVVQGASLLQAAGMEGCAQRIKAWYKQGYEASLRDSGWEDQHAAQLDLFLKVNQAYGMAGSAAQKRLFKIDPGWWLTHNPEARAEAMNGSVMAQLNPPETTVVEADRTVPVIPSDAKSVRERIRIILQAGGGLPSQTKTIEGSVREEGEGTNG